MIANGLERERKVLPENVTFVARCLAYTYPVNASRGASPHPMHDSGTVWFAPPVFGPPMSAAGYVGGTTLFG